MKYMKLIPIQRYSCSFISFSKFVFITTFVQETSLRLQSVHSNIVFLSFQHENVFVKKLKKTSVQLDRDTLLEIKLVSSKSS